VERLAACTSLAGCLCLAAAASPAQAIFCTQPEVLRDASAAPIYLGRDAARLTHFAVGAEWRPRLVYKKRRAGALAAHELHVLEGSRPMSLIERDRCGGRLPDAVYGGVAAPWIEDFAVDGGWLLLAVSDARTGIPAVSRAPAQVLLVELVPGGAIAAVHVLASYWGDGRQLFPRVRNVRFDREPDPAAVGPLVSWTVTHDAWQLGAPDDVWFCRIGPGGPQQAPQRANVAGVRSWYGITRQVVTEAAAARLPLLLLSARTATPSGTDGGIFAAVAGGGPSPWLDEPGIEEVLDRARDLVFYLGPALNGCSRVHAAMAPAGRAPHRQLWEHDESEDGTDSAFTLSGSPGFTRATWPDGPREHYYGMFETHAGETFSQARGVPMTCYETSDVCLFEAGGQPVSLRKLAPYSTDICTFAQAISRNLCIITVRPRVDSEDLRVRDFLDDDGDVLAIVFHCAL